jgi:hypothetical protein
MSVCNDDNVRCDGVDDARDGDGVDDGALCVMLVYDGVVS